jgi:hypothetical protein
MPPYNDDSIIHNPWFVQCLKTVSKSHTNEEDSWRNVPSINGSVFIGVTLSSISIESGNERFVIENGFLIHIIHQKLIRNVSKSSEGEIAGSIEIVGSHCFSHCSSVLSIAFESNSRLNILHFHFHHFNQSKFQSKLKLLDHSVFQNVNHFHQSHLNHIHD